MKRALLLLPVALLGICLLPSGVGADVTPGKYRGKTIPGGRFYLRVTDTQRVTFLVTPRLTCSSGKRALRVARPQRPPKLGAQGRFTYREAGRAKIGSRTVRYRFRVRGRVRGNVARGRYAVIEIRGSVTCRGKGRWSVRRS